MSFFSKAINRVSELKEMVDGIMAAVGQVESVVDAVSEVAEDVMEIVDRDDDNHEGKMKSKGKGKEEKPSSGKAEASAAESDATASASAGKTGASPPKSGADVADTLADKVHGSLVDAEEAVGDAMEASAEVHAALDALEQLAEEGVSAGGVLSDVDAAAMEDAAATALSNAQAAAAHAGASLESAGHSAADAARSLGDAAAGADLGAEGTEILEEMSLHSEAAENVAEAGGKLTNNLEEGLTDFLESLGAELAGSAEAAAAAAAAAGEFTGEAMSEDLERGVGGAALEGDLGNATTESSLDIAGDAARALLENLTESSGMEGSLGGNNTFMEMITNASLMDLLKHNSSELEMVVGNSSFQELCMSHLDDLDASRTLPEEEEDMTMVYVQMAIDYIKLYGAVVARAIWAGILAAIAWLARIGMGFAIGIALWAVLLGVATMFLNQALTKQKLRPA